MSFVDKINDEVKDIKSEFGYPNEGTAFGHFAIKRCISKIIDLNDISDLELDNFIKSHVTDKANDNGIDVIFSNESNQIFIFQFKYSDWNLLNLEEFKKTKRFLDWIFKIKEDSLDELECNNILAKILDSEITPILEKDNYDITFFYVGSYFDDELKSTINNLDERYRRFKKNIQLKTFSYERLEELYDDTPIPTNLITLDYLPKEIFEREDGAFFINEEEKTIIKSLIMSISAMSLKKALKENDFALFELNVRYFKGASGEINKSIVKEYEKASHSNFWYLNNGITGICTNYDYLSKKNQITIDNLQIVNGCQTTKALEKVLEVNPNVSILFRLHAISDIRYTRSVSSKIAVSSNKQNPINSRDLRSNEDVQRHIFEEFDNLNPAIFYDKKDNSWNEVNKTKYKYGKYKYRKVRNTDLALSYISLFMQIPVSSAGKEKIAFSYEAGYYEKIFDDSKGIKRLVRRLLFSYLLEQLLEKLRKENLGKYPKFLNTNYTTDIMLGLSALMIINKQNLNLTDDLEKTKLELMKVNVDNYLTDNSELTNSKEFEDMFDYISNEVEHYICALDEVYQESEKKPLNINNWLKNEKNYEKLVKKLVPKINKR